MVGCMSYVFYAWFFFLALGPYSLSGASHVNSRIRYTKSGIKCRLTYVFIYGGGNVVLQGLKLVIVCRDSSFSGCRADAEVGSGR